VVPLFTHCPGSTESSCSTPSLPARTCMASICRCWNWMRVRRMPSCDCCALICDLIDWLMKASRRCSTASRTRSSSALSRARSSSCCDTIFCAASPSAARAWRSVSRSWLRTVATVASCVSRCDSRLLRSVARSLSAAASWRPRLQRLPLHVGVGELGQHGAGLHRGAGQHQLALHAAGHDGGDPADVLGDQGAGAAHLAQHVAAAHRVGPHGGALHGGGGRVKAGERHGGPRQHRDPGAADHPACALALFGAGNVHGRNSCK
jgi:hypothetical protein